MKEDKPGWQKAEPVERVYVKYEPKNNLPTHESTLPNQRNKEDKALTNTVCVTNEANQNLTPSQKELLQWHFRLGNIGFQHVQWLIGLAHHFPTRNSRIRRIQGYLHSSFS